MPFLLYAAIALVAVVSVALDMDMLVEPARTIERAAVTAPKSALPPPAPAELLPPPDLPQTDAPPAKSTAPRRPPAAANCNVEACAAAYHTFTASDCTYQPSNGPRRRCTK